MRTSRPISETCLQQVVECVDPECGASFGTHTEITHGIRPSRQPNPEVKLRMTPPRRYPANDDDRGKEVLRPANDVEKPPADEATG